MQNEKMTISFDTLNYLLLLFAAIYTQLCWNILEFLTHWHLIICMYVYVYVHALQINYMFCTYRSGKSLSAESNISGVLSVPWGKFLASSSTNFSSGIFSSSESTCKRTKLKVQQNKIFSTWACQIKVQFGLFTAAQVVVFTKISSCILYLL